MNSRTRSWKTKRQVGSSSGPSTTQNTRQALFFISSSLGMSINLSPATTVECLELLLNMRPPSPPASADCDGETDTAL